MKNRIKTHLLRVFAFALTLVVCLAMLGSCSSSKKTLMSLGDTTLSLSTYELLLSRMKGTLAYNGYEVETEDFWNYIWSGDGATYGDYFSNEILNAAKDMLMRLYLFEEVYDLTLPDKNYDEIDAYMQEIIDNEFDGSKTAFNKVLGDYGVNYDLLRENYIIEDKLEYLNTYLSARTADNVREEYYKEHYLCFRQILFPLYEYVYETDENGDVVYYEKGSNHVAYDKKNGKPMTATDGSKRTDKNGDIMYFNEDGTIAYDTKDGEMLGLDADKDGYVDTRKLSSEEVVNVTKNADNLKNLISQGDFTIFETYGEKYAGDDGVWDAYPGGIFLSDSKEYSLKYLNELAKKLADAQVGDIILHESDNALHLVMKYPLADNAWDVKDNSDWFGTFEEEVMESLVAALCEEYADQIVVDNAVLGEAKSLKEIGSNTYY
jgi:hypothetical protein